MKIEIVIGPNGQTSVETKGFTGPACREASRFLEQALGPAKSETLKPEFHQVELSSPAVQQQTYEGNGGS